MIVARLSVVSSQILFTIWLSEEVSTIYYFHLLDTNKYSKYKSLQIPERISSLLVPTSAHFVGSKLVPNIGLQNAILNN